MPPHIELYRTAPLFRRPEWRWRFRAGNGEIMANSTEGYVDKADAEDAIHTVRAYFPDAPVYITINGRAVL